MKRHGRPILGAISGLLFGLAASLALVSFGVLNLDNIVVGVLPPAFFVIGIIWALVAPLGGGRKSPAI
jgi:hypothetical protein